MALVRLLGGKGAKFDRDGDGKDDEPLEAKELGDIVTWEARIRLSPHSRDPRDWANLKVIAEAVTKSQEAFSKSDFDLLAKKTPIADLTEDGCIDSSKMSEFLKVNENDIHQVAETLSRTLEARDEAVKKVANRPVFTLVGGGVERKDQFGPSSVTFGLHGDWRKGTFNLDWTKTDALLGSKDEPKTLKAGLKYTTKWLKGSLTPEGVDLSASAVYEVYRDVAAANHDQVAKLNVAFEYPVAKGMKIPVSVTWANHADLLTGEKDIRGHIGFTLDLSQLTKGKNTGEAAMAMAK